MGGSKVGKTAIIKRIIFHQFLSTSKENLEEMHQWHCKSHRKIITFNIEDTGESFAYELPWSSAADVVCLVYAVDDMDTFEHVSTLRDRML